jgi:uroporphyrinogen-III synthase
MPSPTHEPVLGGMRVWVTRPEHQAQGLCDQIQKAGGQSLAFPLLAIESFPYVPQRPLLRDLAQYHVILFVSANAVSAALPHVQALGGLPASAMLGVVGAATARALRQQFGRDPDLVPEARYDSEGLLALAPLQRLDNKAVLIIRGDGGRETLAETLRGRGARVDYAAVYRRRLAPVDLQTQFARQPDVIVITSGEALRHLAALAEQQQQGWVFDKPLVVVHERIKRLAEELGFRAEIRVSDAVDDAAVVKTLRAWVQYTGPRSKEDTE